MRGGEPASGRGTTPGVLPKVAWPRPTAWPAAMSSRAAEASASCRTVAVNPCAAQSAVKASIMPLPWLTGSTQRASRNWPMPTQGREASGCPAGSRTNAGSVATVNVSTSGGRGGPSSRAYSTTAARSCWPLATRPSTVLTWVSVRRVTSVSGKTLCSPSRRPTMRGPGLAA